jgi:hypothetical protein
MQKKGGKAMRGKNARETLPFKIDGEKRPSHLGGKRAEPEIDTTANSGERLLTTLIMSSQIDRGFRGGEEQWMVGGLRILVQGYSNITHTRNL